MQKGLCRAATCIQETLKQQCECRACVPQLGNTWECEVPNLLSGSAVAVQGKFGVDARPWKSCPSHARTCRGVREGKLRPHGHPEGSRLPQGRKGTGLPRSGEAAAQGAQQRPAAIWGGATRWKI